MKRLLWAIGLLSMVLMACSISSLPGYVSTPAQPPVAESPQDDLPPTLTAFAEFFASATAVVEIVPSSTPVPTEEKLPTLQPVFTEQPDFRNLQPDFSAPDFEYKKQSMSPAYLPNFAHPEAGCNWMGVAGQIFDAEGLPTGDLVIVVEGQIDGQFFEALGFTGLAKVYGPEGYEVILGDRAQPGIFWLQVFDLNSKPLSNIIEFEMTGDCEQNLALINLYWDAAGFKLYVPLITN
ncbi:MAG: hypothetical protein CL609_09335 [Anaerolineaceae bacterium]|nr:hypothetical protein [Anaerolineaceae bacterium]